MDRKFSKMIQGSVKGGFILILGQLGSTLILAVGTIIVARLLKSSNYGVLSIALTPINLAFLLVNNGVSRAIINILAKNRHDDNQESIKDIIFAGFILNTIIGIAISLILFFLSGYISTQVYDIPELESLIKILSFSILAQALLDICYGVFMGFEMMGLRGLVKIIFSIFKTIVGPLLVYYGYGPYGAAIGNTATFLITTFIGLILVFLTLKSQPYRFTASFTLFLSPIIAYAYPLVLASLIQGGLTQVFNFVLPFYASTAEIGNYSAATSFSVLVGFFLTPLTLATFPLLSKLSHTDEVFEFVFQNLIKYETLLVFPIVSGVILFSNHLVTVLYGSTYLRAATFLRLLMLDYYSVGVGFYILKNILNSQKETKITFQNTLIYLIVSVPVGFFLIPRYGVIGLQLTQILAPKIGFIYLFFWVKRNFDVSIDYKSLLRISLSTILSFLLSAGLLILLPDNLWIEFILGGFTLVVSYILLILFTRALTRENIIDIHGVLPEIKYIKPLENYIFQLLIKIARD